MIMYLLLFFCILAIFTAMLVILVETIIYSFFFLILTFFNVSLILILLGVDFIAIIFIIVYVGAIAVLFLFVLMMLNLKVIEEVEYFWRYIFLISVVFFFAFVIELFLLVFRDNFGFFVFILKYFFDPDFNSFKDKKKELEEIEKLELIEKLLYWQPKNLSLDSCTFHEWDELVKSLRDKQKVLDVQPKSKEITEDMFGNILFNSKNNGLF